MKKLNLEKIDPKLKVGYNCFLMNISGILELRNCLSYALIYTNMDLYYDFTHFFTYLNPKKPEEYISETNELVITGSIDLICHKDYDDYYKQIVEDNFLIKAQDYDLRNKTDLEMEKTSLEKGVPVIFSCDHYYLFEEYRQQNPNMHHYHTRGHSAILIDLDLDNQRCTILDKFFGILLTTSIEQYVQAKTSDYLQQPRFIFVNPKELNLSENERIRLLLKKNIQQTLQDEITLNGNTYIKNVKALGKMIADLPEFIIQISELKGKYAPQFATRVFKPARLQRVSFKNLMSYVSLEIKELQEIVEPLTEIQTKWVQFDMLCDKCFLKNERLIDYTDNFVNLYKGIYDLEVGVLEILSAVEKKL